MKLLTLVSLLIVSALALPPSLERRIWNGNPAQPHQAPYLIGILWFETATTVQPLNICGGAIVNQRWVITVSVIRS
jgi:secreted trypsin-like serine protease